MIALSSGLLAYIFQIQVSFPTATTNVAFWSLLGASVAMMHLQDQENDEPDPETTETGSVETAPITEAPRAKAYELLTVVVVVAVLATIAVPTSLEKREQAAEATRADLTLDVNRTVRLYEWARESRGTYPEAGVYTSENPIRVAAGGSGLPRTLRSPPPHPGTASRYKERVLLSAAPSNTPTIAQPTSIPRPPSPTNHSHSTLASCL